MKSLPNFVRALYLLRKQTDPSNCRLFHLTLLVHKALEKRLREKLIKDVEVYEKLVKMQQDFTKEVTYQTKPLSLSDKSYSQTIKVW